jgi:DNA-binding NarL/FixJ family response regulator
MNSDRGDRRIRVAIADDHPVVLAGIKSLLQAAPDIDLVGEAASGTVALAIITQLLPDVAVLDLSMPGVSGLELTRLLAERCPGVKIIALTVHEDRAYVQPLLQAGARGFLLKRSAAEELVRAVRAVADGGMVLDPAVADMAFPERHGRDAMSALAVDLSPRETDVLRFTAQGFGNKEIAGRLDVSVKTVETYKARAAEKLGLRSRAAIVRYGAAQGWLDGLVDHH